MSLEHEPAMLGDMPGLIDGAAAGKGFRTSRVTANTKTAGQFGSVALLTLVCAAVVPRNLMVPHAKTPLDESLEAEGRRLYAAVHGLARPAIGSSTGIANATILLPRSLAPCWAESGMCVIPADIQHALGREESGSATAMAAPAKRAREEGGGAVASKRRGHRSTKDDSPMNIFNWRCLACHEVFAKHAHWVKHVERSPFCEDAACERFEPQQEALAEMCAAAGESSYASDVQQHLVGAYATLQYEKLVPRAYIQSVIKEQLVEPLTAKMKDEVLRRLASTPEQRRTLEQQIGTVFDPRWYRNVSKGGAQCDFSHRPSDPRISRWKRQEACRGPARGCACSPHTAFPRAAPAPAEPDWSAPSDTPRRVARHVVSQP